MSDPETTLNNIIENIITPVSVSKEEFNNVFKNPVLIQIKKIDNSLTENDFELSTKFSGTYTAIDIIDNKNTIELTIIGKNKASGECKFKIDIDKYDLINLKTNIKQGDIIAPSTFKVVNPQEVNQDDLYQALKPNILSTLKNKFKVNLKESDFIFTCLQPHFTDSRTTFDMSNPTTIEFTLDGRNWTVSGPSGRTAGLELTMPPATKKVVNNHYVVKLIK